MHAVFIVIAKTRMEDLPPTMQSKIVHAIKENVMKQFRPGTRTDMIVFYVMLETPMERKPKALSTPIVNKHLALVVNRF